MCFYLTSQFFSCVIMLIWKRDTFSHFSMKDKTIPALTAHLLRAWWISDRNPPSQVWFNEPACRNRNSVTNRFMRNKFFRKNVSDVPNLFILISNMTRAKILRSNDSYVHYGAYSASAKSERICREPEMPFGLHSCCCYGVYPVLFNNFIHNYEVPFQM